MANRRVSADRGFGRRPPSRGYRQARQRRWAFDSLSNVRSQFKHSVRRTPAGQVLIERRPSPHRGILVSSLLDSASRRGRVGVTTWGTSGVAWPRISVPARESFSGLLIMGSAIRGSGSWWHSLGRGGRPPRGLQSVLLEHTALQHLFLERLQGRLDLIVNDRDFQRRPFEAPAEHRR